MAAPGMSLQNPSQYLSTPEFPLKRKKPCTNEQPLVILLSLRSGIPTVYFLGPWVCLFWTFYISCACLLSLSIMSLGFFHIVACIRTSFLLVAGLLFVSSWMFKLFPSFGYLEQYYCEYSHTNFYTNTFFMPLGQILRSGTTKSRGSLVHEYPTSKVLPDGFPQWQNRSHTQPALTAGQDFLIPISSSLLLPPAFSSWSFG